MNNKYNGRVNIKSPNTCKLFNMYDKIPSHQCTTFRNPTGGVWDTTLLSSVYFSKENIEILQNGIRAGVYKKSNNQYIIGQQDEDTLKIIMRSIYLQYSVNINNNITKQIEELNNMVLNYCIQQIYGEAQGYKHYINDVSTLRVPISRPVMDNETNRNTPIIMKNWF